ncbi:hypothetical protein NQZ68_040580 [Dissostichus eleginoides]|nr:hypothetical protein NQZ68_040580 [Dissostichus eleginoides]
MTQLLMVIKPTGNKAYRYKPWYKPILVCGCSTALRRQGASGLWAALLLLLLLPGFGGRMAAAEGPEPRCPEDSSDSEPEQEPGSPQKLIRKVSTSGQIRSKVRGGGGGLPDRIPGQRLFCSGGRRAVPRSEAAGGGGLFPGQRQRGEEGCSPVRGSGGRRAVPRSEAVL